MFVISCGGNNQMDFKQIGIRIKKIRYSRGLSQEKLAELIDVSPLYIYEIERGSKTMSLYTLDRLVTTLNISADFLLYGHKNTEYPPIEESDKLSLLTDTLTPRKRATLAEIVEILLPRLK